VASSDADGVGRADAGRRALPTREVAGSAPVRRRAHVLARGSDWRFVLFRALLGFDRQRGADSAAALTYLSFLGLFPITLSAVSALALVTGRPGAVRVILAVVSAVAPPEGVEALSGPLSQLSSIPLPGLALAIGIVLTLWTISAYAACFGRVLNGFYEVAEGRSFWRARANGLLLSVPLAAGGAVVATIVLTTPRIGKAVARAAQVDAPLNIAWQIGKWPLLLVVLALMLGALYRWTPNVRRRTASPISYGAFIAIAGWALFSAAFTVWVTGVGRYRVYGWLTGALVITLWLYLSNLVLVFGASIDTEVVRLRQLRQGIEAEVLIKVPLRDETRNLRIAQRVAAAEAAGREIRLGEDYPRRERIRLAREAAERAEAERRARLDPFRGTPSLGRPRSARSDADHPEKGADDRTS
jgi:membrane protein